MHFTLPDKVRILSCIVHIGVVMDGFLVLYVLLHSLSDHQKLLPQIE